MAYFTCILLKFHSVSHDAGEFDDGNSESSVIILTFGICKRYMKSEMKVSYSYIENLFQ